MAEHEPETVAALLRNIEQGWQALYGYIDTLSEAQLTGPTDAAGWTAKDHLIHIATWEESLNALLERLPRWESIGVDKALWDREVMTGELNNIDGINAIVQKRYQDMSLVEVRHKHKETHERLLVKIEALSDDDLQRPIREYQPGSTNSHPIVRSLIADTYEAYSEHTPWIATIVAKA